MANQSDGNQNVQSAKVLQLGFNISVSGDPDTDFQIVLDDKGQRAIESSQNEDQGSTSTDVAQDANKTHKHEIEKIKSTNQEVEKSTGAIPKQTKHSRNVVSSEAQKQIETEKAVSKDLSIINEIKNTMEHFEKFSDHIKEIPRLRNHPLATSTPFSDYKNSRSETVSMYPESRMRKFSHLYDFQSRKEYFKGTMKPLPPDLFLKPLPGEDCYKRGMVTRCLDLEPYRHYSVDGLARTSDYKSSEYESKATNSEPCVSILKKYETESGDKQSTSSAESVKDIKIYQSGGILIMQNFKENFDVNDKREQISDFSAKLIENCNRLKQEIATGLSNIDEKPMNSSEELRNSGKMVQFDLSGCENHRSKSGDSSSNVASVRIDSSGSTSDLAKSKDTSPQGTSQSQDFASLSTQENDSILSNLPGTSPTFGGSGKKLEWDSGADVGYLNLDLSKENLSTIERIVLKGLSSDGLSEKKVIYEKKPDQPQSNRSKFVLERMPSELVIEEIVEAKKKSEDKGFKGGERKDTETVGGVEVKNDETKSKFVERIPSGNGSKDQQQQPPPDPPSTSRQKPSKDTIRDEAVSDDVNPESQIVELADKSTNVNTLFEDEENHVSTCSRLRCSDVRSTESSSKVKGSKLESSKVKKLKKKRILSQRATLTGPLKEKIDSIINLARNSSRSIEDKIADMGIPKVYRKLEESPELNELELSREVDEIIIDQRFKIKQNVASDRGDRKEKTENVEVGGKKGVSRPISGSSSSNNTVLQSSEVKENRGRSSDKNRFANQMIQTNDAKVESVGIQAFSSQKSSVCDYEFAKKEKPKEESVRNDKEGVNVSSKNIQAFGLNCSLPRQLAHPRESKPAEPQNTKSTQFFGGPINSLPNYHSNVVTKGVESCGHVAKVLKPKKNVEAEVIRLNEENRKNILANDASAKKGETRTDSKDTENKENLITEVTSTSKRSSEPSQESGKKDAEKKAKRKSEKKEATSVVDSIDVRASDDVSSNVLTSEILREHGGSIDRNIIQEKYFQSQLIEFEKKKMISRSTSMERRFEDVDSESAEAKNCVTVGCQCSPKENTSEEGSKRSRDGGSRGERGRKYGRKEASEQYDSSQNMDERFGTLKSLNQEQDFGTGDSLPSSTQTAHSWVPGMQDSNRNEISGVGRARSFEYLPGHIYESSGNLREELPSETEQNVITGSSSGSSIGDLGKCSTSYGLNESEGRHTLVLENSNETTAQDSGRMKSLDENLTQLDLVVTKLWEKDDQIQCITQSLLVNIRKETGSGDCSEIIGGTDTPKTEVIDNKDSFETPSGRDEMDGSSRRRKTIKEKEFSIACQTEEKSCGSDEPERFYEERKALEKRISQEKESQIKWIENEIHHLNILRGLLEKQSLSSQRKKRSSALTVISSDVPTPERDVQSPKSIPEEVCRRSATPTPHGSPIPVQDDSAERELPASNGENCKSKESKNFPTVSDVSKYGMAVTLTGGAKNLRRVVMLPVGVQVTMKDKDCKCSDGRRSFPKSPKRSHRSPRMVGTNVDTQYPSVERRERSAPSTSAQGVVTGCVSCGQRNCVCLNLSGKSEDSTRRSSQDKSRTHSKCQRPSSVNKSDTGSSLTDCQMSDLEKYYVGKESRRTSGRSRSRSTTEPDTSDAERYQRDYDRRQSNSSAVLPVVQSQPQNVICRCESRSKHTTSQGVRTVCRHTRPNVYVNCEKTFDDYGSCHCSKVQVQRGSNCVCHVIKIHGSKCCSPVNGGCSCRRRQSPSKKVENQFSQTDDVLVLKKKCAESPREPEVVCPSEERPVVENELKESMEEKLAVTPRIPYESKDLGESETKGKMTEEVNEPDASVPCQCQCQCQQKQKDKEKPKQDDHPRHYFLKIEETEVDDLNDSIEERKTLEVITVTVPVKKAGKSKIYGKKIIQSSDSNQCSVESFNGIRTGCNCCKTCLDRAGKESGSRKTTGKSPTNVYSRSSNSIEDDYNKIGDHYKDVSHPSFSSPECYPGYDAYEKRVRVTDSSESKQGTSKSGQSDYDSHKECRRERSEGLHVSNGRYRDDKREQERSCQGCRCRCRSPNECANASSGSRIQRPPSSDYYNYNKKEFMTKSELLKEEEKKKKKQGKYQPSLQECLASNRPDFYNSAENRRQIISERTRERVKKHNNRMECLINLIHQCDGMEQTGSNRGWKRLAWSNRGPKRIFTTSQMREQTMKRYKRLPEVTGKVADQKKKEEYKTNKLMADIFAKKLQLEALKGHINLSNSVSILSTI